MTLSNEQLTAIYNKANGITDKNPPISTKFIFAAMQAAYDAGLAEGQAIMPMLAGKDEEYWGTVYPNGKPQPSQPAAPEPKP